MVILGGPARERAAVAERPAEEQVADLQAALGGTDVEVRFGRGDRALYCYDASIFRQVPIGVVLPRSAEGTVDALAVCRAHEVPVLGRGCGTGLAGQTVNTAVVFDFSKHMNHILELDPERRVARVQPGTICDTLRDAAEGYGLTFGPDPATHDHATLGGMIGNNSCGTHSVMAGKTVDNIDELEVLTYDGLRIRVGATSDDQLEGIIAAGGRRGEIYAGLKGIRDRYADAIRRGLAHIPRRVSGYNLDALLPENGFHVARALVGTEGTCALTLEATCRLVHSPPERCLVALGYPDLGSSGDDVEWLMGFGPIGLEFTSRRVVDNLHRKGMHFGGSDRLPDGECWLLVEFGGESKEEADDQARHLFKQLEGRSHAPTHRLLEDPEDETAVWEVRRHSAGTARMPVGMGGHGGWPNWEDAAVPPARLGDYLRDFSPLLDRYGYQGVFYGHWGQGCVHCRIDWDLRTAEGIRTYRRFMEEAADLVVAYGGSLSGEHGDGHGRAELWPKMFGPELMAAFDAFKAVWDPGARMNPHKLVDPYPLDSHLREGTSYRTNRYQTVFQFPEDGHSFGEAANRCFGVGKCRHTDGGVMCPSFMATGEEKHSTRGRARLLQEMISTTGELTDRWRNEEVKEALDLCLSCKGCKGDCPVQVDMATYKAEFLSHYYKGRARPRQAYALGLIPLWARLAGRTPAAANFVTHAPVVSRMVKGMGGVAAERDAPRFARRPFVSWFSSHQPLHPEGPPVVLWPDTFTNYFEPHVARSAVTVLEAAGFRVELPSGPVCCGRPLYDYGMLSTARRLVKWTLRRLEPHLRAGTPIVGLEPSCVAVFRDEVTNLLPDDLDAQRLRDQSFVLSELLDRRAGHWELPSLHRRALVQPHCHHHAVIGFDDEKALLRRMGLDLELPDAGCCGMAGSFGYEAGERYRVSQAAGERKLLPAVRAAQPSTLVVADGFSCRSQIASGTDRHGLHLAEVLAMAITEGREGPADRPVEAEAAAEAPINPRGR
jgi:FAD/FMN-containing dehydrogenase/Fe-S oxidoreductase